MAWRMCSRMAVRAPSALRFLIKSIISRSSFRLSALTSLSRVMTITPFLMALKITGINCFTNALCVALAMLSWNFCSSAVRSSPLKIFFSTCSP